MPEGVNDDIMFVIMPTQTGNYNVYGTRGEKGILRGNVTLDELKILRVVIRDTLRAIEDRQEDKA